MTLPYRPRQYVSSPTFTPLPYGLLDALASEIRTPRDSHWEGGVTYENLCSTSSTTYDECLVVSGTGVTPAEPVAKSATAAWETRGALPFTVYAEVDCSAPGFWDRAEQSARDTLLRSEQRAVEYALWTGLSNGAYVVHPHLSGTVDIVEDGTGIILDTAATIITGGLIVDTLGNLEHALAECYDGVGVIHVPRSLAIELINVNAIVLDGNRYVTTNGNVVVLGSGYPGSGPGGDTEDTWMFATGWPFIYRSGIRIFSGSDAFDRSTNTVSVIAERTYVIGWDCCHFAAHVVTLEEEEHDDDRS